MSSILRTFAAVSITATMLAFGGSALASPGHGLSSEQKAQLEAPRQAERAARTELRKALAGQIENGKIDRAALAQQIAAEKQAQAKLKTARDAVLTPEQKAAHASGKHGEGKKAGKEHHGDKANRLNLSDKQKEEIQKRMAAQPAGDRGVDRMIDRFDAMTPVLTPAQRAELARALRK
jgi:Spy/CpxP family protein refolding chaperone